MRFSRPAGLDAFARCALDGCETRVYAPLNIRHRCRAHGGDGQLPEIPGTDPYGLPSANVDGPPPPSTSRTFEVA